jgi:uncharacterized membrane protein
MIASPGQHAELLKNERRHSRGYVVGLILMGLLYIAAGINHFLNTAFYVPMMPLYIPRPLGMIYISGIAEVLGGIGLLVPDEFIFAHRRAAAAWGIVALLIAVSPVHINMCLHPEQFMQVPLWVIWSRLVLQPVLIVWAWWYTRR